MTKAVVGAPDTGFGLLLEVHYQNGEERDTSADLGFTMLFLAVFLSRSWLSAFLHAETLRVVRRFGLV
jgi:hypothetical protein